MLLMLLRPVFLVAYSLVIVFLIGCASTQDIVLEGEEYYEQGMKFMNNANYQSAIEEFRQIGLLYPLSPYNLQSKLEVISAYYGFGDYEEAIAEAEDFISSYPDSEQLDFAYFMIGRSYYAEGAILLDRFDRRTLNNLKSSYDSFRRLIELFPTSRYVAESYAHMRHARNVLAADEVEAGKFYYEKEAYLAALKRSIYVLHNFPHTPAVADALALMVNSYDNLGMTTQAEATRQLLRQSFPNYAGLNI